MGMINENNTQLMWSLQTNRRSSNAYGLLFQNIKYTKYEHKMLKNCSKNRIILHFAVFFILIYRRILQNVN